MPNNHNLYSTLPDTELAEYFRHGGEALTEEAVVLDTVIRALMASEGRVSNKSIILSLIMALESTHDEAKAAILRKTLEIVVGYTPDDA